MRYLLYLSTLLLTTQQTVLNTIQQTQTPYIQNYAIGYSNSSCVRISTFRFQSAASGQASAITLNFVPAAQPNIGSLSISLYTSSNTGGTGSSLTAVGLPLNVQFNTNTNQATYSLTNVNWVFTRSSTYTLTFDTQTRLLIPYYSPSAAGSTYSLTLQQAQQCNSTIWTTILSSGSVIPLLINISNPSVPTTLTSSTTNTPTVMHTNAPTIMHTNAPSNTGVLGLNQISSPTNTVTGTPSLILSNTETHLISSSPSVSAIVSSFAQSQTVYVSASLSPATNIIQGNSAAVNIWYNPTAVVGYALGAFGLLICITCILHSTSKKREALVFSSVVVANPSQNPTEVFTNPVVTQTANPTNQWYRVVEDGDTYYYNDILKKSEWLLPEGGIIIGGGLPTRSGS